MADRSKIEWTDATWNVLRGCTRVSQGCVNCYAEGIAARFSDPGAPFDGVARRTPGGPRWTGKVTFAEHLLDQPLRWKRPRRIFVNSMSDLFHEAVPDEWIDQMFANMALAPQHTFQVLTKRPERMRAYMAGLGAAGPLDFFARADQRLLKAANFAVRNVSRNEFQYADRWPLPNVWLGVSVEDQATADARIPDLLQTPARIRFVSAEPLLGQLCLQFALPGWGESTNPTDDQRHPQVYPEVLDLVIVGGESGHHARPMHPDWARSLRDQCVAAGVAFHFKQWGEWEAALDRERDDPDWRGDYSNAYADRGTSRWLNLDGGRGFHGDRFHVMRRVGKARAGRLLDGRTWDQMPGVADG